jgi:hypothetical protein
MDWGYKKPGCIHWWALDEDDNMFCIKELTFRLKTASWVAEKIKEVETGLKLWKHGASLITGPADTQLWEKRGESGQSKVEEMAALGVTWQFADKRSRQSNAERVSARLEDHENYTTVPGLIFFTTCVMAIRTLPAIQTNPDNVEEPQDGGEDHWHDSICYAAAFASHGRAGIPCFSEAEDYDDDIEDDENETRGTYGYGQH